VQPKAALYALLVWPWLRKKEVGIEIHVGQCLRSCPYRLLNDGGRPPSLIDRHSEAGTQRRSSCCKKQRCVTHAMLIGQAGPGGALSWVILSPALGQVGEQTCMQPAGRRDGCIKSTNSPSVRSFCPDQHPQTPGDEHASSIFLTVASESG